MKSDSDTLIIFLAVVAIVLFLYAIFSTMESVSMAHIIECMERTTNTIQQCKNIVNGVYQ